MKATQVLRFQAYSAKEYFVSRYFDWPPAYVTPRPFYVATGALVSVLIFSLARSSHRSRGKEHSGLYDALLSVFTPTHAAWPSLYEGVLGSIVSGRSKKVVCISVSAVLKHIKDGDIEIRDPLDFSALFLSRLRIYGWTVQLAFDYAWWASALVWILSSFLTSWRGMMKNPEGRTAALLKIIFPDTLSSLSQPGTYGDVDSLASGLPQNLNRNICLDFFAYNDAESVLRTFRSHLEANTFGTIHFTTMETKYQIFSNTFLYCCLPFMPRHYLKHPTTQRTLTPLCLSLHFVTKALSSSSPTLVISSVKNVTLRHVAVLRFWRREMVSNKVLRTILIEEWGERGWREHIFLLDWETGLFDAGLLARWTIVVQSVSA